MKTEIKKIEEDIEEIKEYLKRTDKLLDKLSGEDKDTLEWLIFGYNQCAKMLYEKENIIKEVREYITSYESIETMQQFDHNKNNKDLDYSTIDEMTRRYMIVHDKVLKIIDRG